MFNLICIKRQVSHVTTRDRESASFASRKFLELPSTKSGRLFFPAMWDFKMCSSPFLYWSLDWRHELLQPSRLIHLATSYVLVLKGCILLKSRSKAKMREWEKMCLRDCVWPSPITTASSSIRPGYNLTTFVNLACVTATDSHKQVTTAGQPCERVSFKTL